VRVVYVSMLAAALLLAGSAGAARRAAALRARNADRSLVK
jgi:hypothetical protein